MCREVGVTVMRGMAGVRLSGNAMGRMMDNSFFFFKQNTAYELRISDWSSDVCSSDLGEDVVAGIRTPQYLTRAARETAGAKAASMEEAMPETYAELAKVFRLLEDHYRDMQDIEFPVERGHLWMLQTRTGKSTAKAAPKISSVTRRAGEERGSTCRSRWAPDH